MQRLPINPNAPHPDAIRAAVDVMKRGGVVVYPTDTCYGLGVDARNATAVRRLTQMKHRDSGAKPYSVIVKSIPDVRQFAQVDETTEQILREYLPGPFTFILINLNFRISRSSSIGVRIPAHATTSMLASSFGSPYTTTSANVSGLPSPYSFAEVDSSLITPLKLRRATLPDLMLDAGPLAQRAPSTVIDLTAEPPRVLREGSGIFRVPSAPRASASKTKNSGREA